MLIRFRELFVQSSSSKFSIMFVPAYEMQGWGQEALYFCFFSPGLEIGRREITEREGAPGVRGQGSGSDRPLCLAGEPCGQPSWPHGSVPMRQ